MTRSTEKSGQFWPVEFVYDWYLLQFIVHFHILFLLIVFAKNMFNSSLFIVEGLLQSIVTSAASSMPNQLCDAS